MVSLYSVPRQGTTLLGAPGTSLYETVQHPCHSIFPMCHVFRRRFRHVSVPAPSIKWVEHRHPLRHSKGCSTAVQPDSYNLSPPSRTMKTSTAALAVLFVAVLCYQVSSSPGESRRSPLRSSLSCCSVMPGRAWQLSLPSICSGKGDASSYSLASGGKDGCGGSLWWEQHPLHWRPDLQTLLLLSVAFPGLV